MIPVSSAGNMQGWVLIRTQHRHIRSGLSSLAFLILLSCFWIIKDAQATTSEISVGVDQTALDNLKSVFDLSGTSETVLGREKCPSLDGKRIVGKGRTAVELLMVCNALFKNSKFSSLKIVAFAPHRRRLQELALSRIDMVAGSIFPEGLKNIEGKLRPLLSRPVLKVGQFEKALFTLPNRSDVLAVRSLEELQKFSAVTVASWQVDTKTLKAMSLSGLEFAPSPKNFFPMLQQKRADFTLLAFNSHEVSPFAKKFVRVEGVKIGLLAPRVFAVGPSRPDILAALNHFVRSLEEDSPGTLTRLYEQSNFIKPEYSDWLMLYP